MEHKGITPEDLELLLPSIIFGAEGEGDGDDSGDSGDNNDDGDNAGSDDDDNDDDDGDKGEKDPAAGLKSALAKERARANAAEKKLKAADKAKAEAALKEKSELEQAQIREEAAKSRAEKLAAGYLRTSIDRQIERAAERAGFIDPSDALLGVERKNIIADQDDDDPSTVTVDEKSVKDAIKALATSKPHLLKKGTDDGEPTGGQFGRTPKTKKQTSEEALKEKYSALR
jgi:hypothetical protein